MIEVRQTERFAAWLSALRDGRARARIQTRIDRLELGNAGDARSIGNNVQELRITYGPGYRIYFVWRGSVAVILLCGGDKSSQRRDIELAKAMARELDS